MIQALLARSRLTGALSNNRGAPSNLSVFRSRINAAVANHLEKGPNIPLRVCRPNQIDAQCRRLVGPHQIRPCLFVRATKHNVLDMLLFAPRHRANAFVGLCVYYAITTRCVESGNQARSYKAIKWVCCWMTI